MFGDQEMQGRETIADSPAIEKEARRGGLSATDVDPKMLHNISVAVSRLVAKVKATDRQPHYELGRVLDAHQS